MSTDQDMYAGASETTEGRVFTVTGQDWDAISEGLAEEAEERAERTERNAGRQAAPKKERGRSENLDPEIEA